MAREELIDSHVSTKQLKKAVDALHSYVSKKQAKEAEDELLGAKEQHVWLNITVKKIPSHHKLKPKKIPLVHPLVDPRVSRVCLISKDPQREYKDLLENNNIKFISRVVGIAKLKGKFKPFEARRALLKENGLFLADERVIPLLPKLLGSKWFEAKKQPIPVKMTAKDLKDELEKAMNSTYMNQNRGTCTAVKVGKMSQTPSQILDNLKTALPAVVQAIDGGWDNIQSLHIKTNSSTSLPIWSCSLDASEEGRWHGLLAEDANMGGVSGDDEKLSEEDQPQKQASKAPSSGKGRKRTSDSEDEEQEVEKPRKKAKPSATTPSAPTPSSSKTATSASKSTKAASAKTEAEKPAVKKSKSTDNSATVPSGPSSDKPTAPSKKSKAPSEAKAGNTAVKPTPSKPEAKSKSKKAESVEPAVSSKESVAAGDKKKAVTSHPVSTAAEASKAKVGAASQGDQGVKRKGDTTSKGKNAAQVTPSETPANASKTDISREEIRAKRNTNAVEKKKKMVAKSKGGKSVKNAVLGRKVAQE